MGSLKNSTDKGDRTSPIHGDKDDIMSFETRQMFEVVNYVFICSLVGFSGLVTNSINLIVFYKQGFQNAMTISFMALTISDMCCLIALQWFSICVNPLVVNSRISLVTLEIFALTGGWPHITFGRITGWITVYITSHRCLCITSPLAVQRMITPRRAVFSLGSIYLANILSVLPVYLVSHVEWKFYPGKNRSLLGIVADVDNEKVEGSVFLMHAVLVLTSFLCVTVLTSVLVVKLKGASKWRRVATQGKAQSEAMSTKDKKATSMVVMISSLQIAMCTPSIVLCHVTFIEPKFGIFGAYQNMFMAMWSFAFIFTTINSSVNIFMYYNMSSKYREIFHQTFFKDNRGKSSLTATRSST